MLNIHGCSIFSVDVSTGSETVPTLQCTEGRRPPRTGDVSRNSLPSQRRQIVALSNPCHPLKGNVFLHLIWLNLSKIPWNSQTMVIILLMKFPWNPHLVTEDQPFFVGSAPRGPSANFGLSRLHPSSSVKAIFGEFWFGSQGAWQMSYWYLMIGVLWVLWLWDIDDDWWWLMMYYELLMMIQTKNIDDELWFVYWVMNDWWLTNYWLTMMYYELLMVDNFYYSVQNSWYDYWWLVTMGQSRQRPRNLKWMTITYNYI